MRKFLLVISLLLVLFSVSIKPLSAQEFGPGSYSLPGENCSFNPFPTASSDGSGGTDFTMTIRSNQLEKDKEGLRGNLVIRKESGGKETEIGRVEIDNKVPPVPLSFNYTQPYAAGDKIRFQVEGYVRGSSYGTPYNYEVKCATELVARTDPTSGQVTFDSPGGKMETIITPLKTVVDCTANKFHCDEANAQETPYSFVEGQMNDPKWFQDDSTKRAIVTIKNVAGVIDDKNRGQFYVCLKTNGCKDSDYKALDSDKLKDKGDNKLFRNNNNDIAFYVCPNGKDDLKVQSDCNKNLPSFKFYGGNTYRVGLYEKYDNSYNLLTEQTFYINYALPYVYINKVLVGDGGWLSQRGIPSLYQQPPVKLPIVDGSKLSVTLAGRKAGDSDASGGSGSNAAGTNNNYQLVLTNGSGTYKSTICTSVLSYNIERDNPPDNIAKIVNRSDYDGDFDVLGPAVFGYDNHGSGNLLPGTYQLDIREQVNEKKNCEGGPLLWSFQIEISKDPNKPYKIDLLSTEKDPDGVNLKATNQHIVRKGTFTCVADSEGNCIKLRTALGEIELTPEKFITQAFKILLSLAALIATFTFVLNGYKLLTSAGDKQKIADAREKITSSIIGILFIIFAFVILEFIANDILKIPGFG